jgi:hypothetical protein
MSESISPFVLNEIGSIIDTEGRFPLVPLCQCGEHEGNMKDTTAKSSCDALSSVRNYHGSVGKYGAPLSARRR